MLRPQVKDHILALSDVALLQYVLTGQRLYEPEAIAFAREELSRRPLTTERRAELMSPILDQLLQLDARLENESPRSDSPSITCQQCGFEVPTRFVTYFEEVGCIIVRFSKRHAGYFCKTCNRRAFWRSTLITLFFGWWGVVSFFASIFAMIWNTITFLRTISLPRVPANAGPPTMNREIGDKLEPYTPLINDSLTAAVNHSEIAREIAPLAGVTPGQALCYVQAIVTERLRPVEAPTYGFPVIQKAEQGRFATESGGV
jgi:hypothetical protein